MKPTASLQARLGKLPSGDKALLVTMITLALAALIEGVVMGAVTAITRSGFLELRPETGYAALTLHGVSVFFFWLYFAQGALLLAFAAIGSDMPAIRRRGVAWAGVVLMALGLVLAVAAPLLGTPLLYDASPEVAGDDRVAAAYAYAGYLALGLGLLLIATAAIASALGAKLDRRGGAWSSMTFGAVAWAGLVIVSAIATMNAFLPAALWAMGMADLPADHSTGWHLLFHNLHYLPLMATVLIWYALVRDIIGTGSIFGDRFSKILFTLYLVLVPPTSLYHMFLEPGLSPTVRAIGSLLSLFISVPTVGVFLVIVVSLEAHARARGARGLFGWLRELPWQDPTMAAIGMAVVNLAIGGTFSFVLIQERLAPLLSDTFFVPAYFHFLTVGTVSLTLLAALGRLVPSLVNRAVPAPRLLAKLPYLLTAGLILFGAAGIAAGLMGMPRRVLDAAYEGAAPASWGSLSALMGIGALVMAASFLAHALLVAGALVTPRRPAAATNAPPEIDVPSMDSGPIGATWTGPIAIAILVIAMSTMTWGAFEIMHSMPLIAASGGGH